MNQNSTGKVLIVLSFLVATAFGAMESVRVILHTTSISFFQVTMLILDGCLAYGLAGASLIGLWLVGRGMFRNSATGASTAVGIAIGMGFAVHFIYALARLHQPQLAWLIPGCILMGAVCGVVARFITSRFRFLQKISTWIFITAAIVLTGFAMFAREDRSVRQATGGGSLPNVLLISADTLRSDRLGCYGYANARTPVIDQLAAQGALFEQVTTSVPVTGPAHTTILTGLYPDQHGAAVNGMAIRKNVHTVSEILSTMGYRTAAFVSGWTLKNLASGLANRFDHYDEDFVRWSFLPDVALKLPLIRLVVTAGALSRIEIDPLERPGEQTTRRAMKWLENHRDRPFFMFVHYFDPHSPYSPPSRFAKMHDPDYTGNLAPFRFSLPQKVRKEIISDARRVQHTKAMYDGEISYVDGEVGRLLLLLEDLKLSDNTFVIFTSDHGESLTEHDFFFDHCEFLYDTCLQVPLILRFPHRKHAGFRWNKQIRTADLAPTILDAVGFKQMPLMDGASLLPVLNGSEESERTAFASIHSAFGELPRSRHSVRANGYKLIWNFDVRQELSDMPASEELYDLSTDPGEIKNLVAAAPSQLDELRKKLQDRLSKNRQVQPEFDDEVRERLRSLGYLQ